MSIMRTWYILDILPLSLLNHSALALFAQRTRIPTSARDIGFCAIWVCISSSSTNFNQRKGKHNSNCNNEKGNSYNQKNIQNDKGKWRVGNV